ncbi:MAG: hypothetical protein ACRC3B_01155, partial [Bacteroidia bacterium]
MKASVLITTLLIVVRLAAQTTGDYRSAATGNWATLATWETFNGTAWVAATVSPTAANALTVSVRSPHTVTIAAAVAGGLDQVIVDAGAILNTSGAVAQSFANGAGVDLTINGTFGDQATGSVSFAAGASWEIGVAGNLIKTTASSSNNWQNAYQGGIANIPATANWILRKAAAAQPALSSTTPATGSVYPNLTIENNTGAAWVTPAGSSFTGTTARPTVKGNLDIGGSGSNTVDFLISNTFASTVIVQGNILIRTGNTIRNYGTGIEARGDITINGSLTYDAADGRQLVFGGANTQNVSGTGTANIYSLAVNKTGGGVTLNRSITVDNLATFTSGIVTSTSVNLFIVAASATVAGASNASFVNGPVRYLGSSAFTFPIGKAASYRPAAIGGYTPLGWFESFNNGCSASCAGNGYTGSNGAWTQTVLGAEGADANPWYVSCTENGYTAGGCGTGCVALSSTATGETMHVGSAATVLGDLGAAYFSGGLCPILYCSQTDRRIESPTINCSGLSNLNVSFTYIENGSGTVDNATLWYFDGAAWSQLADMPKTALCGVQGLWTAYSIALPASANNNANVKVGFRWVNNDDGVGTDPSFAVDNLKVGIQEYFTAEYFPADPQVVYNNVLAATIASISNCEYWIIDRAPSATTATTVTLSWDAASCNVTTLGNLLVCRFDGAMWQDHGNGGTTGTAAAGTVVSSAAVTAFSPFTLGNMPVVPLPVEWLSLSALCNEGNVKINWSTASEINNTGFTIQRSYDAEEFTDIGFVNGNGTTSMPHNYWFTDMQTQTGIVYYRIRQTDYNGTIDYSPLVAVNTATCGTSKFEMNNAAVMNGNAVISWSGARGAVSAEVYSMSGELLSRNNADAASGMLQVSLGSVSSAAYIIRISDGFSSVTRRIVR